MESEHTHIRGDHDDECTDHSCACKYIEHCVTERLVHLIPTVRKLTCKHKIDRHAMEAYNVLRTVKDHQVYKIAYMCVNQLNAEQLTELQQLREWKQQQLNRKCSKQHSSATTYGKHELYSALQEPQSIRLVPLG